MRPKIDGPIIIPCYNEAARFDADSFIEQYNLFRYWIFVDDGSTDDTKSVLTDTVSKIRNKGGKAKVTTLDKNSGKAEAVRAGMLETKKWCSDAQIACFTDADLSTPLPELTRLAEVMQINQYDIVLGSRVALQGRKIHRSPARHYMGRIASTLISESLKLPIYDTQAGAKIFSMQYIDELFGDRFISPWLFDCEILIRARTIGLKIYEEPLQAWQHVSQDSKISLASYFQSLTDILRIRKHYRSQIYRN